MSKRLLIIFQKNEFIEFLKLRDFLKKALNTWLNVVNHIRWVGGTMLFCQLPKNRKMMGRIKMLGCALSLLFVLYACSSEDNSGDLIKEKAKISIKMVDAPGDYESVFIDVKDVAIKYANGEAAISLDEVNAGIYDLLKLTGGANVLLVEDEIHAGKISQIRLILGSDNSIVVDGKSYPLKTPSAQQSGLKIQVNKTLKAGALYEFILDFDVEESIVENGNGEYSLKPVIRASLKAETGSISGLVLPVGTQTLVTASNDSTEISSYTDINGAYLLAGVPAGTYRVVFQADTVIYPDPIIVSDVKVENGSTTTLENVVFP